jgi:hypothetical protein
MGFGVSAVAAEAALESITSQVTSFIMLIQTPRRCLLFPHRLQARVGDF